MFLLLDSLDRAADVLGETGVVPGLEISLRRITNFPGIPVLLRVLQGVVVALLERIHGSSS